MARVVAITGASAGVGFAAAEAFARRGYRVGLVARGAERLEDAVAILRKLGAQVCAVPADVADAAAVTRAAERIEAELGPIDVWVNNAFAGIFAPFADVTPEEFARATQVTYLGTVNGTRAALHGMRQRRRGTIVNVGSALGFRAIPLQAVYCAAKYAIRGFTEALRSELIHDRAGVHLTMVHLPAINTPQFGWALNKTPHRVQPMPPVFDPAVAADAILFAATHRRRDVWVGGPTVQAVIGNHLAPGLLDVVLAWKGYSGQQTSEKRGPEARGNLFEPAPGPAAARGRFVAQTRSRGAIVLTSRQRGGLLAALAGVGVLGADRWLRRRFARS